MLGPYSVLRCCRLLAGDDARRFRFVDQLADLVAAFAADLLVERAAVALERGRPAFLATLLADFLVEVVAITLCGGRATFFAGFGDGHAALFLVRHNYLLWRSEFCVVYITNFHTCQYIFAFLLLIYYIYDYQCYP